MTEPSMPPLPEPSIYPLLCEASGETDLPAAFIAHNEDDLRHFITVEWTPGESETEGLIDALKKHDWRELGNYSFEFEIGGMSFSRVYETARAQPLLERIKKLEATLQSIADAKPRTWEPEVRDQFMPWAQNRARAALATRQAEAPSGEQP